MIWDACTFVGRHPFRRSQHHSVGNLLRLMDKAGIDRAAVSPLAGAFYPNAQEANEEIYPDIRKHADRLALIAALNPMYPGWKDDLKRSHEILSARGVRLFPNYHGYVLDLPEVWELASLGLPIFISIRLWDERQHPPTCMIPGVPAASVADLANKHPDTRFVLSMGRYGEITTVLKQAGNIFADIAGVQGPTNCIGKLVAEVGSERLLFATELMLQYALPARYRVDYANLSEADRQRIYEGNLTDLISH
ncbi:MAG TPA: amidohydrolase family protein [Armatimonadota bacterium]|nr:amidohydrolase family protein [Armatimonadota bacterium]